MNLNPVGSIKKEKIMGLTKSVPLLVLCQEWIEYERGWGSRPDGCSVHLTEGDHKEFCRAYWERMPKGAAPDEYSAESGVPFLAVVNTILYGRLKNGVVTGLWVSRGEMHSGGVRRASADEVLSQFTK